MEKRDWYPRRRWRSCFQWERVYFICYKQERRQSMHQFLRWEDLGNMKELQINQWWMRRSFELCRVEDGVEREKTIVFLQPLSAALCKYGVSDWVSQGLGFDRCLHRKGRRSKEMRVSQGHNYDGKPGNQCCVVESESYTGWYTTSTQEPKGTRAGKR